MQNMIFALAGSVPETRLQQQIGWGSAHQIGTAFAWLVSILAVVVIIAAIKKFGT